MALDPIEDLLEARLLSKPRQLRRQVLLERLTALRRSALEGNVHFIRDVSY